MYVRLTFRRGYLQLKGIQFRYRSRPDTLVLKGGGSPGSDTVVATTGTSIESRNLGLGNNHLNNIEPAFYCQMFSYLLISSLSAQFDVLN